MAELFECLLVLQLNLSTAKFKVPETYMFSYFATSGRGTSVNFRDVSTSKGLKTLTYLRMKQMKIGTSFKADTLEITLCSREKIKNRVNVSTLFRFCNIERNEIPQALRNVSKNAFNDVRAQNFPHTDFVKTLTAGRE